MKAIKYVLITICIILIFACNKKQKPESDTDIDKWGFGYSKAEWIDTYKNSDLVAGLYSTYGNSVNDEVSRIYFLECWWDKQTEWLEKNVGSDNKESGVNYRNNKIPEYIKIKMMDECAALHFKSFTQNNNTQQNNDQSTQKFNNNDYSTSINPQTSTHKLTASELYGLSKQQLKIMRNEIYARHGYIFKTEDMKNYFSQQSWYVPRYNNVDSDLTEIEKYNIGMIKRFE